jgi:hypothetical protein
VQGLLAAHFLFAGGMKLITPVAVLAVMFPFPGEFVRFIGICEVLGSFGLILPWALGIRRELTPLAAAGLVIMVGATVSTLAIGGGALALVDVVIGVLAASIVYGRRKTFDALRPTAPRLQPAAA